MMMMRKVIDDYVKSNDRQLQMRVLSCLNFAAVAAACWSADSCCGWWFCCKEDIPPPVVMLLTRWLLLFTEALTTPVVVVIPPLTTPGVRAELQIMVEWFVLSRMMAGRTEWDDDDSCPCCESCPFADAFLPIRGVGMGRRSLAM